VTSPQSRGSSRRTAAARRDQLLDVTARLIIQSGFHGLSIESVARAAGITRGLIYQHFRDLHALLEAVIERETSRALAQVSETTLPNLDEGDPLALMLESLRAFLGAVQSQPTTWRLILMPLEGAPHELHDKIAEGRAAVLERMSRAVTPVLAADRELPDAALTAHILSATADEYARLILIDPDKFSAERLLSHARWWVADGPLVRHHRHRDPDAASMTEAALADRLADELIDSLLTAATLTGPGELWSLVTRRLAQRLAGQLRG
jgi:AcrR family transcriptional regulator